MDFNFEQYNLIYNKIKTFILNQNSPFNYYFLFSFISKEIGLNFPDSKYFENLYRKNFLIKNILYNLQFEFYKDFNFALIFENELIFFEKIPDYPSYFSIFYGKFIRDDIKYKKNPSLCESIDNINKINLPYENKLRIFYLSLENFNKEEEQIQKAIDTGLYIMENPGLFDEALKIFNLTQATLNERSLNIAYKKLVKKYHPDLSKDINLENDKEIIKIYEAYKLLKNILI